MHIVKLAQCMLYINMYSFSALYMLRSVPIVKVILVILFKKNKKKPKKKNKKKPKKKKTHTLVWVKIPKLCHKNPAIYLFLGKEREFFVSNFIKKLKLNALSAPPSSTQNIFQIQALCGRCTPKFTQNGPKIHFLCKFRTFPVTEGYAI